MEHPCGRHRHGREPQAGGRSAMRLRPRRRRPDSALRAQIGVSYDDVKDGQWSIHVVDIATGENRKLVVDRQCGFGRVVDDLIPLCGLRSESLTMTSKTANGASMWSTSPRERTASWWSIGNAASAASSTT